MVPEEGNDSDETSETGSDESRQSPSRGYSAGQSRPTSRGRPGRDDEDEVDENEDPSRETNDEPAEADPEAEPSERDEDTAERGPASESSDAPGSVSDESESEPGGESPVQDESDEPEEQSGETEEVESREPEEADSAPQTATEPEQERPETTESAGDEPASATADTSGATREEPEEDEGMYEELDEFRGFSMFEGLGPESIATIVEESTRKQLAPGEKLFEEDDEPNGCFYLIVDGEIEIVKFMRTETTQVTTLDEGDYFGEFGMFTGNPRMAGAESRNETELLEIPKSALDELRRENPEALADVYENMFDAMAKRFKALARKAEKSQFWL